MKNIFFDIENEPTSAIMHFAGFLYSIAALILLVYFAVKKGTVWHIIGFTIFGSSMILLYAASTLYHITPITSRAKEVFKRIDHSMIYVLIAGTYTPICFITLKGAGGWSLFGTIWTMAIIGIIIKSTGIKIYNWLSTTIYLVMGWLAGVAILPLKDSMPTTGLIWLFAGGISYSIGAIFFSLSHIKFHKKWFGMHEIWHLFVMLGSFCHFWLILNYLF